MPAWKEHFEPFLIQLAQQGYPNPVEYDNKEKLIIDYTFSTGKTQAVTELFEFMSSQQGTIEALTKEKKSFKI